MNGSYNPALSAVADVITGTSFKNKSKADVCIIGAGVAGSALAYNLGKQGMEVIVIERDLSEPDKFIGELLQPGGVIKLQEMGFNGVLEGFDAQSIEGYGLFMDDHHFNISYPKVNGKHVTGRGFRYGKFIMSLRKQLAYLPSVSVMQGSATGLLEKSDGTIHGVRYTKEGKDGVVHAPLTVVCDGGFSGFRKNLHAGQRKIKGFMVGLLLKNCPLPYPSHGHVFLTGSSPVLSYPVSSNETRMLIDFPGMQSPKQNGEVYHRMQEISQQLPEAMRPAFLESIEALKIKAMPAGMVAAKPVRKSGVVMLGDTLNMRHPLTGGGMTAALTDVQLLTSLLLKEEMLKDKKSVERITNEFYKTRHHANATINILADALYDVMSYPDLKDACYQYLSKGDQFVEGPISILSAISRNQSLLLRHFFAVAIFGAAKMMKPFPNAGSIARSYKMIREAVNILKPLLLNEQPSMITRIALKAGGAVFPESGVRS